MEEILTSPVLAPRDAADLAAIVAASGRPLEPVGGGTKRAIGRPTEHARLDLKALAGIVAYEPAELVLTARAATPLALIEQTLSEQRQRLAFEPPDLGPLLAGSGRQTLGGVVATNLAGSRRLSAGAARDHFIGFEAVNGWGELFRAGGKVVKNVTGYDLPKLLAGSWGTLAVLTEVTVRVVPAVELDRTLVLPRSTPSGDVALLTRALGSPHEVSAAGCDPERGNLIRLEGFSASVEARTRSLCADLGMEPLALLDGADSRGCWKRHAGAEALAQHATVWRISVPPAQASETLARLAPDAYLLDWGGGLIYAAYASVDCEGVRASLGGGHALLLKASAEDRASNDVFHPPHPVVAAAAARLKQAFDPRGVLNPGRMA